MAELDQGVGELGDDPFGSAVKQGGNSLVEGGDLGDFHWGALRTPPAEHAGRR